MAATIPSVRTRATVLDAEHAAFMQSGVSIVAASRQGDGTPTLNRACGCRVARNRRLVTLFFWRRQAQPLLAALVESGLMAVVFSEAPTHRTIQVKGEVVRQAPARPSDRAIIDGYRQAFARSLVGLGFPETFGFGLTSIDPEELTAVAVAPAAAFMQTPGPGAGEPLVLAS